MMENGFSSPRSEIFPAGLRVLVVDDDPTWLKILEKMLKKCSYEVTTCCLARDALRLLRERKDGYDIVISDVNMPDMDGFKLLEHVGLEMDLPVIMMSVDGETSRVMKGVQHGACDYLLKPIRMKELRNIWQHVFRKKINEVRDIESFEGIECIQMTRNGSELSDDGFFFSEDMMSSSGKKRKEFENKNDDKDLSDSASAKKPRVVWSVDLHQKFVKAVNHIGFDKVGPKKILNLMNVPWLTRENVASHLQKYRLYLCRLMKENELKSSFSGIKHTDTPSKDIVTESFGFQNQTSIHSNDVSNGSYRFPGEPRTHEADRISVTTIPSSEPKRSLEPKTNFTTFGSDIPTQFTWSDVPDIQFKQEHTFDDSFTQMPIQNPPHQIIHPTASISPGTSIIVGDVSGPSEIAPPYIECRNNHVNHANHASPTVSTNGLFPIQTKSHVIDQLAPPEPDPVNFMKRQDDFGSLDSVSLQRNLNWVTGSPFGSLDDNLQFRWMQGDSCGMNLGLQKAEYNDSGLLADIPIHLYDALKFDYENLCDPTEYSVMDQGLFIV